MQVESDPGRWLARRANSVSYDATSGVFVVRTWPRLPSLSDEGAARSEYEQRLRELEYEPLRQTTLPNALARIAVVADTDHEAVRDRRTETPERRMTARAQGDSTELLAERAAARSAEAAARREAKRFLLHYGPLGYQKLKPDDRWPEHGEPLGWILAEAETVRFTLEVVDALLRHDEPALRAALAKRRLPETEGAEDQEAEAASHIGRARYAVCRDAEHHGSSWDPANEPWLRSDTGWCDPTAIYLFPTEGETALADHAGRLVADLITHHAPHREDGFSWRDGRFREMAAIGPLLCAVWLHVKRAALGESEIRSCQECGAPFLVSDQRQQFCPPEEVGGKSRCLGRQQMRLRRREEPKPGNAEKEA